LARLLVVSERRDKGNFSSASIIAESLTFKYH
jgi:hypothetical protein